MTAGEKEGILKVQEGEASSSVSGVQLPIKDEVKSGG
jgi:hypothetical protein